MKNTGIEKHLDRVGRITLPIEIRNELNIYPDDKISISYTDSAIILTKMDLRCCLCGTRHPLFGYHGSLICKNCIKSIGDMPKTF